MGYFNEYEKDEIIDWIKALAGKLMDEGKTDQEIIESIMQAVAYGINSAMFELEKRKEKRK